MPDSRDRSRSRSRSPPPSGGDGANASSGGGEPMKLYIGNLSYDTDENRLRSEFESFGAIDDVFLPTDRETGRPRGFGFVTFTSGADANKAITAKDGAELDGRTIKVSESRPRGSNDGGRGGGGGGGGFNSSGASSVKLFVGNLSFDTSEDTVRGIFEEYGEVTDCYMPTDRETQRPRGFAFVTMKASDAENACGKVDGQEVDGRSIRVNEARAREDRGGGGGYGGGGGGYGGGGGGYGGGGGGYGGGGGGYRGGGGGGGYDRGGGDGGYGGGGGGGRYGGGRDYDNDRGGRY